MKPFNGKSLVSLSVLACFLTLTTTGVLLYFFKHANATAAVHTSFAALFLLAAGLHIRNNFKSLKAYSYKRGDGPKAFFKKELVVPLVLAAAVLGGLIYELPGVSFIYTWGNERRSRLENKEETRVTYQHIETNPRGSGATLELDVKKGKAFGYPLFAVWIEDMSGRYLQTLYVSKVIGTSVFDFGKKLDNGEWVPGVVRRPEALPYWGHKRGVQAKDGYFLPDADTLVPDVVSAATPTESFVLRTRTDDPLTTFRLFFEVNQSFDWNEYFSETRFPDDKIYSGEGKNGQPSVVYTADIDLKSDVRYYAMNPAGHGHPGGQDGTLDKDLSGVTTAFDIVDGPLVKISR
jgi:hypothetical protein